MKYSCLLIGGLAAFLLLHPTVSSGAGPAMDPIIDSAFHPAAESRFQPASAPQPVEEPLAEVETMEADSAAVCDSETCPLSPRIDLHEYPRESPPSPYLQWNQQGYICWIPPERGEGRWVGLEGWVRRDTTGQTSERGNWEWIYQKKCHPWNFIGAPRPMPYMPGGGVCMICGKPWSAAAHQFPPGIQEYLWNPLDVAALNLSGIDDAQLFGDSSILNGPVRARSVFATQWRAGKVLCRGQCLRSSTR